MKPSSVAAWKEAVLKLSDRHFFNLMRLYLGPVKTPFSKQKLVDSLSAFLRKPKIRENILAGLDYLDLRLISGVIFLTEPDRMKLVRLFSGEYQFPELYDRILNLEERLLIFRTGDDSTAGYRVNPHLEEDLRRLAGFSFLFSCCPDGETGMVPSSGTVPASDLTAAGIFCYFLQCKPSEKQDSFLKKKDAEVFSGIFPDFPCPVDILTASLKRLSLIKLQESRLVPDIHVWKDFSALSVLERTIWLCAAISVQGAVPSFIRERAAVFSLLAGCLSPERKYRRSDLDRLVFLIEDNTGNKGFPGNPLPLKSHPERSRFASILASGRESSVTVHPVEAALFFGLLVEEKGLFSLNSGLFTKTGDNSRVLFVEPSFEVTLLQGSSLKNLLSLMYFMEPVQIQTAGLFRITRRACSSAFSAGETEKNAVAAFSSFGTDLPENVLFSLEDWYSSFSSVHLYNGFVVKVEKRIRPFFEKGGNLHFLVREELSPGVYLLKAFLKNEIESALEAEGIDFLSPLGSRGQEQEQGGKSSLQESSVSKSVFQSKLPSVAETGMDVPFSSREVIAPKEEKERSLLYSELKEHLKRRLEAMDVTESVRAVFESRIASKTIVSEEQMNPDAIRFEKNEAKALDFSGKLHVVEQACKTGSLLEIITEEGTGTGVKTYLMRPDHIENFPDKTSVKGRRIKIHGKLEPGQEECSFSVAGASSVRIISGSVFSDDTFLSD